MGIIKVSGYAERSVEVDTADFTIRFSDTHTVVGEIIKEVNRNCELFLEKIKEYFDVSKFRLEDDRQNNYCYSDPKSKNYYREISFRTTADPKINNLINTIIKDNSIKANVNVVYSYSKEKELHKELLKEATENSREKAEIIASASGSRILSLEKVTFDRYDFDEDECEYMECNRNVCYEINECLSDRLSNKLHLASENIYVTWKID